MLDYNVQGSACTEPHTRIVLYTSPIRLPLRRCWAWNKDQPEVSGMQAFSGRCGFCHSSQAPGALALRAPEAPARAPGSSHTMDYMASSAEDQWTGRVGNIGGHRLRNLTEAKKNWLPVTPCLHPLSAMERSTLLLATRSGSQVCSAVWCTPGTNLHSVSQNIQSDAFVFGPRRKVPSQIYQLFVVQDHH